MPSQRSRMVFERLEASLPGANTRTATFYPPFPIALVRGEGPYAWDADGNRHLDLVNNYTSLVHGHAAPEIVEAISREAGLGTVFPSPIVQQGELAERIIERFGSVDQVRFTNSGTEANMQAVRLARAVTGRPLVVKADRGYHGSWDGLPSVRGQDEGIPRGVLDQIRWIDYNSAEGLTKVMAENQDQVAAIIIEPVLGCGVIPASQEFLETSRRLADSSGALLIFDEVVTARLARGGSQELAGVFPDITTLGKVIGGGLPIGAFGASAELMRMMDPRSAGALEHQGTFNGNSLAMAAGTVSLDLLDAEAIGRINDLGARLASGLRDAVSARGADAVVTDVGSLVQIHFGTNAYLRSGADLRPSSTDLARFHRGALERGVYIAPRGELNVSTAATEDFVDEALGLLDQALAEVVSA